jgi:hypothetical protein
MPSMRLGCPARSRKFCSVSVANGMPSPPAADEGAQQHACERQPDGDDEPQDDARERDPAPGAEPQRPRLAAPAAQGDVALGHPQQIPLQINQRQRHAGDGDDDHGHELIRGRAQNVGELEQIRGQHQHVGGIADDERQAEQLEAEKEDQDAAIDQRRPDERQGPSARKRKRWRRAAVPTRARSVARMFLPGPRRGLVLCAWPASVLRKTVRARSS